MIGFFKRFVDLLTRYMLFLGENFLRYVRSRKFSILLAPIYMLCIYIEMR